jgi:hypothetical protein
MDKKQLVSKEEIKSVLLKAKKKDIEYKNILNKKPNIKDPIQTVDWLKDLLQVLKK